MATWQPPALVPPTTGCSEIFVDSYPSNFKECDILYLFRPYGAFRCFVRYLQPAIVTFNSPAEANAAIQAMNGKTIAGTQLKVEPNNTPRYEPLKKIFRRSHRVPESVMGDNLKILGNRNSPENQRIIMMDSALRDCLNEVTSWREYQPRGYASDEPQFIKQIVKKFVEIMQLITEILIQYASPAFGSWIPLEDYHEHLRRIKLVQFQFDHGMVETLDQNNFKPVFRVMCKTLWRAIRQYYLIKDTPLGHYLPVVYNIYHNLDYFMMKFDLYERL